MSRFFQVLVSFVVLMGVVAPLHAGNGTLLSIRQEIKSIPIEARPNTFGHVYGNTLRRQQARQEGKSRFDIPRYYRLGKKIVNRRSGQVLKRW